MDIPYDLLVRYCRKETTSEENNEVEQWLSLSDNYSVFMELKKEWKYSDKESLIMPDKEALWGKIGPDATPLSLSRRKRPGMYRIAVAASVIIVFAALSALLIFNNREQALSSQGHYTTISAQESEKKDITLSDGTNVYLNSGTSIRFDEAYDATIRKISLEGEAFLDVTPSDKKFIVDIGSIQIKVLGTSFNVRAYNSEHDIEISLKEGKIVVVESTSDKPLFEMHPLQTAVVNKQTLNYILASEEAYYHDVWKVKELSLYDEPADALFKKLEAWYGIKISYTGVEPSGSYTFNLADESLVEFLELFSIIEPMEYHIEGGILYINFTSGH